MTFGAYGMQDSAKVVPLRATQRFGQAGKAVTAKAFAVRAARRSSGDSSTGDRRAERRRHLGRDAAAVGHLSRADVLAHHGRRRRQLARRAPGVVQHHAADRGGDQHRAGRDARAVAIDPRRRARRTSRSRRSTDMIYALQQVQARVNQVRSDLPAGPRHRGRATDAVALPDPLVQSRGRRSGDALRHRALPDQAAHLARARRRAGGRAGQRRPRDRGRRRSGATGARSR